MKKIIIFILLLTMISSCSDNLKDKNNNIYNKIKMKNFSEQFFWQIWVEDFKKELTDADITLIDVRTPWELLVYWKIRENQLLINISDPNFVNEILKLDKKKKYLLYCWHWNRSEVARHFMQQQWFSYVKDLRWWIEAWVIKWEKVIK